MTTRTGWLLSRSALCALAACNSAADPSRPPTPSDLAAAIDRSSAVVTSETSWPNDPISIDSAGVEGDTLVLVVRHGGGCVPRHSYRLIVGTAWMESFPVQAPARVSHDALGDVCRALVRRDLRMSLRPVADAYRAAYKQQHGTVSLLLTGTSALLWYKF